VEGTTLQKHYNKFEMDCQMAPFLYLIGMAGKGPDYDIVILTYRTLGYLGVVYLQGIPL
jgi:hypothetical protein